MRIGRYFIDKFQEGSIPICISWFLLFLLFFYSLMEFVPAFVFKPLIWLYTTDKVLHVAPEELSYQLSGLSSLMIAIFAFLFWKLKKTGKKVLWRDGNKVFQQSIAKTFKSKHFKRTKIITLYIFTALLFHHIFTF